MMKKRILLLGVLLAIGISAYVIAEPITCVLDGVKKGYSANDATWTVWVDNATCASRCEEGGTKVCTDYKIKTIPN